MLQDWIWLTTRKGLSARGAYLALRHFGTPQEAFQADEMAISCCEGLTRRECEALADKSLDLPQQILAQCLAKNIRILTHQDAAYPGRLRNLDEPPLVLYYLGRLPDFDAEPVIGVVGTRKASGKGLQTAHRLGYQIAACGGLLISGLAAGIDEMAMRGAVSTGRPVVGVLGCGVDVVYPLSNRSLYLDTLRYGCLISEYPPGTEPLHYHFPVRNRIISGLSLGVVVIEAPARSGALITASRALEQGRDVFAVPGAAGEDYTAGSNRLLKEGAILAESGWDVMQEYYHLYPEKIKQTMVGEDLTPALEVWRSQTEQAVRKVAQSLDAPKPKQPVYLDIDTILPGVTPDEAGILTALRDGPLHVDALVEACQLPTPRVLASVTLLEVKGFIKRLPGHRFSLAEKT